MGYRCQLCNKSISAGIPSKKVVTAYCNYMHPMRFKAMSRKVVKNGKKKIEYINDPGGPGLQIIREASACPDCAAEHERKERELRGISPNAYKPIVNIPLKEITPEPPKKKFFKPNNYQRPFRQRERV